MKLLDCNDASLRLWHEGEAIWSPGIAWLSDGRYQFGQAAWAQSRRAPREINNRFWHRLSTQPLSPALGQARHTADLVHAHLETLLGQSTDDLTLIIPGAMEPDQLSLLLGILQTLPVETRGVVHRSALVGAYLGTPCAHVELHLHQTSITPVSLEDGHAKAGITQLLPGQGLLGLMDEMAERIAEQFVAQTRFDPQRRAETEQVLYEKIPELLQALSTQSEVSCTIEGHTARVSADALRSVGEAFNRAITPLLPEGIGHVALDTMLSTLPGLALAHTTTAVPPEAAAMGAERLPVSESELVFQREVACSTEKRAAAEPIEPAVSAPAAPDTHAAELSKSEASTSGRGLPATHQLIAGQATPLAVGATLAEGVTVSGISELLIQAGSGAQINGNPVEGSLSVCAGDRLTMPAVEILLIAVAS
ncbi:MAG: hypothetical protein VW039_04990 [Halieaceae bacterium]